MRQAVLAVITLLSVPACNSRDTATAERPPLVSDTPSAPASPQTSKWELDPENSSVEFVCKHVFTNVRGMFQQPSGTVTLDEATPANSKVNATIDVNSITTGVEERDTHLKGSDFFDVAKYPVDHLRLDQLHQVERHLVLGDGQPDDARRDQAGDSRGHSLAPVQPCRGHTPRHRGHHVSQSEGLWPSLGLPGRGCRCRRGRQHQNHHRC